MVTFSDSVHPLDPWSKWSSLRDLSGTDLMGPSSIYTMKQTNWWMRSMRGLILHILRSIYIPSEKAPRLGVLARRGLGAFLVL